MLSPYTARLILCAIACFCSVAAGAQKVLVYDGWSEPEEISDHLYLFTDTTGIAAPAALPDTETWIDNQQRVPNLGVTPYYQWAKITIENRSEEEELQLTLASPILDEVYFYRSATADGEDLVKVGEQYPYDARLHPHQYFVFDLHLKPYTSETYYLRVKSQEQVQLPLYLASEAVTADWLFEKDVFSGFYFGILVVMMLYNLFIYFTVRDRSYLFYVMYIITLLGTQASFMGYSYRIVWPDNPWMAANAVFLFSALVTITGMLFMRQFLELKQNAPRLNKIIVVAIVISTLIIPVGLIVPEAQLLAQMNGMITALLTLYTAIVLTRKGSRAGKFYLAAWTVFLIGVFVFVMKDLGVLPYNALTVNMMPVGSAIEVILLSLALADRINALKRERLDALRENERIVKEQNIILEQKVQERTNELVETNQNLNTTLEELKEAQSQLVEAEKMASLGQLTAGIAHEINNPINFVTANIRPLRRDFDDLVEVYNRYDALSGEASAAEIDKIEQLKKELDTDFIKKEIEMLIQGIEEGAHRTAEIVKGLRIFSRLDEAAMKSADINEGLKATLSLLRNSVNPAIQITTDYADLPEILCYPGKLNQLFMNILNNAIQAIDAHAEREEPGKLHIKTQQTDTHIVIAIIDNGTGMTEEVKRHIFEPFYTTKDVGKGTGLGMSIGYKVVEMHHGSIEIDTEPGKGTAFKVILPKNLETITATDKK